MANTAAPATLSLRQCKNPFNVLVLGCFSVGDANELHHSYCLFCFTHCEGNCSLPSLGKGSPDTQGFCENKKILACVFCFFFYFASLLWSEPVQKRIKHDSWVLVFMGTPLNIIFSSTGNFFFLKLN